MASNPGSVNVETSAPDRLPHTMSQEPRVNLQHDTAEQLEEQWARVRIRLQQEVGDVEYRTWLRQISLGSVDGDEVTVHLPTRFLRDWVRGHYADKLNALWQSENKRIRRVDIRVGLAGSAPAHSLLDADEALLTASPAAEPDSSVARPELRVETSRSEASRAEMAAPLDTRFEFDSFVVGKPNEFAYACARRVAERPSSPGFNPCSCMAASAWARPI